jgi:hypothetical protein
LPVRIRIWPPTCESRRAAKSSTGLIPSLFAALPQQLGLKLEDHKAPFDVLVIDHLRPAQAPMARAPPLLRHGIKLHASRTALRQIT